MLLIPIFQICKNMIFIDGTFYTIIFLDNTKLAKKLLWNRIIIFLHYCFSIAITIRQKDFQRYKSTNFYKNLKGTTINNKT